MGRSIGAAQAAIGSVLGGIGDSAVGSRVVGNSILGNIDGNVGSSEPQVDSEALAEQQRKAAEMEAEINRQIAKAKEMLAEAEKVYEHFIEQAEEAYTRVSAAEASFRSVQQIVRAATEGSHIGYSQFNSAVESAIAKCQSVKSMMASVLSGGVGGGGGISVAVNTANTIHVTPEILHAVATMEAANDQLITMSHQLVPEMAGMGQEAADISVATQRMEGVAKQLEQGGIWMFRAALDIRYVYVQYHKLQEAAIIRASKIPG